MPKGKCPECNHEFDLTIQEDEEDCPACGETIEVDDLIDNFEQWNAV